jgi:aryl-alcohol dehydrogenase-like predicted oxidoreductase
VVKNFNFSKKLIIGSANFGNQYGLKKTKVSKIELNKIFRYLELNKINYIDTAKSYGDSEKLIGENNLLKFKIISKLPKLNKNVKNIRRWTLEKVYDTLRNVKKKKIYAILIHNPRDLLSKYGSQIYQTLIKLKKKKVIKKIGISVYNPHQADILIKKYKIDIIQIPFSVFDRRILQNNWIYKIKKKKIEIHVRSVFLQGLLLKNKIPKYFKKWKAAFTRWNNFCKNAKISKNLAALKFVASCKEIDKIVLKKMLFIYNALDSGWSVSKSTEQNTYIFKKPHLQFKSRH